MGKKYKDYSDYGAYWARIKMLKNIDSHSDTWLQEKIKKIIFEKRLMEYKRERAGELIAKGLYLTILDLNKPKIKNAVRSVWFYYFRKYLDNHKTSKNKLLKRHKNDIYNALADNAIGEEPNIYCLTRGNKEKDEKIKELLGKYKIEWKINYGDNEFSTFDDLMELKKIEEKYVEEIFNLTESVIYEFGYPF